MIVLSFDTLARLFIQIYIFYVLYLLQSYFSFKFSYNALLKSKMSIVFCIIVIWMSTLCNMCEHSVNILVNKYIYKTK